METNFTPSLAMLKIDVEFGLKHASHCLDSHKCGGKSCTRLKRLLAHPNGCSIKASGGCSLCIWYWHLNTLHANQCRDDSCSVLHCKKLRPVRKPSNLSSFLSFLSLKSKRSGRTKSAATSIDADEDDERRQQAQEFDEPANSSNYEDEARDKFETAEDDEVTMDPMAYMRQHDDMFSAANPMYSHATSY